MVPAAAPSRSQAWRRRIYLPSYQVGEAARYAGISAKTVREWHRAGEHQTLPTRESGEALSYVQLIEVAVVAALRQAGVTLRNIRAAREYVGKHLKSKHPFAEYGFKHDGKSLFMEYSQIDRSAAKGKLLRPDRGGQLAWDAVIGRLQEFEYETKKIVIRWHVAGSESAVFIDPRISFGTPVVNGIPTWAVKGQWEAGEDLVEIADDLSLTERQVIDALAFEGIDLAAHRGKWTN